MSNQLVERLSNRRRPEVVSATGLDRTPGTGGRAQAIFVRALALYVLLHVGCGCSDDAAPPDGETDADTDSGTDSGTDAMTDSGTDGSTGELSFSPCPLVTQAGAPPPSGFVPTAEPNRLPSPHRQILGITNALDGLASAQAECATAELPARWSEPEGDSIDVFVKRYPARQQPAQGQFWMLQGGPGYPGSDLETLAFVIADAIPTLDIYLPDHRGTGKSTPAICAAGVTNLACVESIPHRDGLTITGAARDLAFLIDESRNGSQQVFVYGVSYGTQWAQRYMQIRPDQASAVILDSVMPAEYDWADSDKNDDAMARRVLALCEADATCSGKLGTDPIAAAKQAIAAVRSGTCKLPIGVPELSTFFGALVARSSTLSLVAPSVYRALRCDEADVAWFAKVRAFLTWQSSLFSNGKSVVLLLHIVLSEFWHPEATLAELLAQEKEQVAMEESALIGFLADSWPKYPRDEYHGKWPAPSVPILVLQGGVDPLTPYGELVQSHYSGEKQYYVEMPHVGHAVMMPVNSPMPDRSAPGCGIQVVVSFLADPTRPPDTSCVAGMEPLDVSKPPQALLDLAGIQDVWENP